MKNHSPVTIPISPLDRPAMLPEETSGEGLGTCHETPVDSSSTPFPVEHSVGPIACPARTTIEQMADQLVDDILSHLGGPQDR